MDVSLLISGSLDEARAEWIESILRRAFAKGNGRLSVSLRLEGTKLAVVDARAQWSTSVYIDYRRTVWTTLELAGVTVAGRLAPAAGSAWPAGVAASTPRRNAVVTPAR